VFLGSIRVGLELGTWCFAFLVSGPIHTGENGVDEHLVETPPLIDTIKVLRLQCALGPPVSPAGLFNGA